MNVRMQVGVFKRVSARMLAIMTRNLDTCFRHWRQVTQDKRVLHNKQASFEARRLVHRPFRAWRISAAAAAEEEEEKAEVRLKPSCRSRAFAVPVSAPYCCMRRAIKLGRCMECSGCGESLSASRPV